ncbi:MAG: twitching motility protein PilT, partial [Bacteroidetes bacterium]|nr:twitching motility protein PilT [Bacteroidota bacterium]
MMSVAYARFYAELNDRLPPAKRYVQFSHSFDDPCSVEQLLTREGVLVDEVDLVLVNGESARLSRVLKDGDRLSVYPVFESFDVRSVQNIRADPLRKPRFVLDVHLGKLASLMRMLGLDALYSNAYTDEEILAISRDEERAVLSRDRALLQHESLTRGYRVREKDPRRQVLEVLERFDLRESLAPLTRCLVCNTPLGKVAKEEVIDRLPPRVRETFEDFWQCMSCKRVFWRG